MSLNLARKPFLNLRPIRRIGLILIALGAVMFAVNGYLYWNHLTGQGAAETGLLELDRELEEETTRLEAARAQLEGFDQDELNRKIEFVNFRILQRTFSWSRLFDQVAETLPRDVRLTSLTPRFGESGGNRRPGRARTGATDKVSLEIRGQARTSEALLAFVDQLFAHVAFTDPDLHQETVRLDTGLIVFSITTPYLPDAPEPARAAAAEQAKEAE